MRDDSDLYSHQQNEKAYFPTLLQEMFFFVIKKMFWPHSMACGTLAPGPGIKPVPPALESQSLNQWTTREVQKWVLWTSIFSFKTVVSSEISLISNRNCSQASLYPVYNSNLTSDVHLMVTYLYKQDWEDTDFISQLAFCPVLIHSADHSDDIILKDRKSPG